MTERAPPLVSIGGVAVRGGGRTDGRGDGRGDGALGRSIAVQVGAALARRAGPGMAPLTTLRLRVAEGAGAAEIDAAVAAALSAPRGGRDA